MDRQPVIDVSHGDGNVDYNAWITKHNLGGVIVKAGGNETRLRRYSDSQYENNYKKAKSAGLHVGAYYYTVVTSVEEAKKDAEHLISLLEGHEFDMPIYMDVEDPVQFQLDPRTLTDVIKTFCDTIAKAGYYAGLYMSGSTWLNNVVTDELRDYANGIAWGRAEGPTEAGDIGLWQQGTKRLSDGQVYFDDVAGCTDFNGCIIDYPERIKAGWTQRKEEDSRENTKEVTPVAKDNRLTQFCDLMYKACAEWSLGYDQYRRWDIRDNGACDCSSLVIGAAKMAGFDVGDATYTGNMSENFTKRGWKRIAADLSQAQPGDILLNDNYHTAAVISGKGWNAQIAQASIDERGQIAGGQLGDQTGRETNVRSIYNYSHGWDCILRYTGETTNGTTKNKLDIDGVGDIATIRAWQKAMGTTVDGTISGQLYENWDYFKGIQAVSWERSGSELVSAIQRKVKAEVDGFGGPETSKAIQKFLIKKGFKVGADGADGYFGTNSVKALQRSLNSTKNPWKTK